MAITAPTYEPVATAEMLAQAYVQDRQDRIALQTKTAAAQTAGLTKLRTAMSTFETALAALTTKKSMVSNSATLSAAIGTATATSNATAGTYSFYVEKLATAGQVSYGGITETSVTGSGSIDVVLADGSSFTVNLGNADKDLSGKLTAKEIAAAINVEATNNSRITASTMMVNNVPTLVLTSNATGKDSQATIDATNSSTLNGLFTAPGAEKVLVEAVDGIFWVGDKTTGTKVEQASNVLSVVDDVKITFTKAQLPTDTPVTVTVANDKAATQANVQSFVDSYNTLTKLLAEMTSNGDPQKEVAGGVFASDSGVLALRSRMSAVLRKEVDGVSLVNLGITGQRDGTLSLNAERFAKSIAADPLVLDKLFGGATLSNPTGVLGELNSLSRQWTSTTSGQINKRREGVTDLQNSLAKRTEALDITYEAARKRYLAQFTALQQLQSRMNKSSELFDALFGNKSAA